VREYFDRVAPDARRCGVAVRWKSQSQSDAAIPREGPNGTIKERLSERTALFTTKQQLDSTRAPDCASRACAREDYETISGLDLRGACP